MLKMFAIRDAKSDGFATPFFKPTPGIAEREFRELAKDPQTTIAKNPEDFSLYQIGEWDHVSGLITSEAQPRHICNAN